MKGHCLCGSIEIDAPSIHNIDLCHCSMCRRWGSGPMHALHCEGDVSFSGDTPSRYRSSEWAERGFCRQCGTHLFYYLIPADQYILSAGLFQQQELSLTQETFVDEKPDYYSLQAESKKMTGAEVFAQYEQ
ncbi:GFA family protein [Gilvimarinus xylanilyticus]|uniref:GFA family protein n=1 Tax=Gilvimarinus xylanilyticus TaxID=2944139 RepID=A0A9X2KV42_9GAMM|nr:GFA family protein [Gilvimarinus xylanilyticus]MCP8900538.1 GFA family protein [Gilvimarinus xylanilyticus]